MNREKARLLAEKLPLFDMTWPDDMQEKWFASFRVLEFALRPMLEIPLPLAPQVWGRIVMPCPLTPEEWGQMMAILEVMRPALVTTPPGVPMGEEQNGE